MEMGHGDEIVLADGNFPATAYANRLIRYDGHNILPLLDAIMRYFPLDQSVPSAAIVMALAQDERAPDNWEEYHRILRAQETSFANFNYLDRFGFYERAQKAFVIVATSDQAFKGNLILKKGVVREA